MRARKTDPNTSKMAAQSNFTNQKSMLMAAFIKSYPVPITALEAAEKAFDEGYHFITFNSYWKRVSDLLQEGLIEPIGVLDGRYGKRVRTYRLTENTYESLKGDS